MPHVEIKHSDNLELNHAKIFDKVEQIINQHDSAAGVCKSRAYPCAHYKHTHIMVTIALLTKPHRDKAFTVKLSEEIEAAIKSELQQSAYFSLDIDYSSPYYVTSFYEVVNKST